MSYPFSAEQLERLLDDARSVARGTSRHEAEMDAFVSALDEVVLGTETACADALAGAAVPVDPHRRVLADCLQRSVDAARTARRLCSGARQQRLAAGRLLAHLDPVVAVRTDGPMWPGAVLVVDDYSDNRHLAATVLRRAGFIVETAANGLEGLLAAYDMRPAVIVMDVVMPVLDGIEATRLIKAATATSQSRVIAYTGTPPSRDDASRSLFAAVLQKPASPTALVETVRYVASL